MMDDLDEGVDPFQEARIAFESIGYRLTAKPPSNLRPTWLVSVDGPTGWPSEQFRGTVPEWMLDDLKVFAEKVKAWAEVTNQEIELRGGREREEEVRSSSTRLALSSES